MDKPLGSARWLLADFSSARRASREIGCLFHSRIFSFRSGCPRCPDLDSHVGAGGVDEGVSCGATRHNNVNKKDIRCRCGALLMVASVAAPQSSPYLAPLCVVITNLWCHLLLSLRSLFFFLFLLLFLLSLSSFYLKTRPLQWSKNPKKAERRAGHRHIHSAAARS